MQLKKEVRHAFKIIKCNIKNDVKLLKIVFEKKLS